MDFSSFIGKIQESDTDTRVTISVVGNKVHCFFYNGNINSGNLEIDISDMPDEFQAMYTKCKLLEE